jgi:phage terminase small subunit
MTRSIEPRKYGANPERLNPRQRAFVDAYQKQKVKNGTAAAIEAGYAAKSARAKASQLLSDPLIKRVLGKEEKIRMELVEVDKNRVAAELAAVGLSNIQELVDEHNNLKPISEWPEHAARAVASLDIEEYEEDGVIVSVVKKIRLWPKVQALELLCKRLEMIDDPEKQLVLTVDKLRKRLENLNSNTIVIDAEDIEGE